MPGLLDVLKSRGFLSVASAVFGGLFWNYVALHRGRVRALEYSVNHNHVGFSAQDVVFGNVTVTWQGNPVQNLFLSTVTVENNTFANYKDLKLKVYTGDPTFLLNERRIIEGSTYIPVHTPEYAASILVAPGNVPTAAQNEIYWHSREYLVPVLNRKQRMILTYVTTVPGGTQAGIWVDTQHAGVTAKFKASVPQVHGVPQVWARGLGLVACVAILPGVVESQLFNIWLATAICMLAGLSVQAIGATMYRIGRFVFQVLFH